MSTRGTIAITSKGRTIRVYNHSDSYPSWLGKRVAQFARKLTNETHLVLVQDQIAKLTFVDETVEPDVETFNKVKELGLWQDVSSGKDWYSLLREAQGDVEAYLKAGYWPSSDGGDSEEWGYHIDLDERSFKISAGGQPLLNFRLDDVPSDQILDAIEE